MSYPPPPEPFPPGQPFPPPAEPAFQPGVASPAYQQPGYGEPHTPGPPPGHPYPGKAGRPPSGRGASAALLWSLIAVFAVLLCAGATTAGVIAYQNANEEPTTASSPGPDLTLAPEGKDDPTAEPGGPAGTPPAGGAGTITFEVTGSGRASIQYLSGTSDGLKEVADARLPWQTDIEPLKGLELLSITATRQPARGQLGCRILVDGQAVVEDTASGRYAVVNCFHLKLS